MIHISFGSLYLPLNKLFRATLVDFIISLQWCHERYKIINTFSYFCFLFRFRFLSFLPVAKVHQKGRHNGKENNTSNTAENNNYDFIRFTSLFRHWQCDFKLEWKRNVFIFQRQRQRRKIKDLIGWLGKISVLHVRHALKNHSALLSAKLSTCKTYPPSKGKTIFFWEEGTATRRLLQNNNVKLPQLWFWWKVLTQTKINPLFSEFTSTALLKVQL